MDQNALGHLRVTAIDVFILSELLVSDSVWMFPDLNLAIRPPPSSYELLCCGRRCDELCVTTVGRYGYRIHTAHVHAGLHTTRILREVPRVRDSSLASIMGIYPFPADLRQQVGQWSHTCSLPRKLTSATESRRSCVGEVFRICGDRAAPSST